jgi:hypothetical protein
VGKVVEAIRDRALHPDTHPPAVHEDDVAEDIAQAYIQWAKDNANERDKEERKITSAS